MKTKTFIFLIVLAVCAMIGNNKVRADTGTPAGTRITNWATVDFNQGNASNSISTQVMAIYSAAPVTAGSASNLSVAPGNSTNFSYSITNKSDIPLVFNITLTNFALISGYAGGDWTAWLNLNPTSIITGTPGTNYSILTFTTNIPAGASINFQLYMDTDINSDPLSSWGEITMNIWTPGYTGDNGTNYGATNYSTLTPRVNLGAAYIALKKTVVVTNTNAIYLASGIGNIPVPESILTYTNYYDNDGTAKATNLEIRDRIPYHTDFIFGSIVSTPHTGGNITEEYYDGISPTPLSTGGYVAGIAYPEIREIRFVFTGVAVGVHDNDGGTDTYGIADGPTQDTDAGYIVYKVVVHRRK